VFLRARWRAGIDEILKVKRARLLAGAELVGDGLAVGAVVARADSKVAVVAVASGIAKADKVDLADVARARAFKMQAEVAVEFAGESAADSTRGSSRAADRLAVRMLR